jgi:hypothetical protein
MTSGEGPQTRDCSKACSSPRADSQQRARCPFNTPSKAGRGVSACLVAGASPRRARCNCGRRRSRSLTHPHEHSRVARRRAEAGPQRRRRQATVASEGRARVEAEGQGRQQLVIPKQGVPPRPGGLVGFGGACGPVSAQPVSVCSQHSVQRDSECDERPGASLNSQTHVSNPGAAFSNPTTAARTHLQVPNRGMTWPTVPPTFRATAATTCAGSSVQGACWLPLQPPSAAARSTQPREGAAARGDSLAAPAPAPSRPLRCCRLQGAASALALGGSEASAPAPAAAAAPPAGVGQRRGSCPLRKHSNWDANDWVMNRHASPWIAWGFCYVCRGGVGVRRPRGGAVCP